MVASTQRSAEASNYSANERAAVIEQMLQVEGRYDAAWDYYLQMHPLDRAEVLAELRGGTRRSMVAEMAPETVAGVLEYLDPRMAARMLRDFDPGSLALVLDLAEPGTAAEVLERLPEDKRQQTINEMVASSRVETMLRYEDGSAGRLIDLGIPVFGEDTTAPIAIDRLRLMGDAAEQVNSLPVVNAAGVLVGTLKPVRLALSRPNSRVGDIMDRDLPSVTVSANEEEAAHLISRFKVSDLPVVEEDGRLAGLIHAEDAVEVVEENVTEDMFRIASIGEERVAGPIVDSILSRFPWLAINLVTVFLAATVIGFFESTIAKVVVLAAFLPVVAGQGGIGGTQTVTLVVRAYLKIPVW